MSFVLSSGAFRLLLAGMVFVAHVSSLEVGRLAVILFFVLSGYWISDLWKRQQGRLNLFLLNRFLRVWPLYMIVVLIAAGVLNRELGFSNIFIFGVASVEGNHPLGVEWSLDIELQFYLILPLLALLVSRMSLGAAAACACLITLNGWIIFDRLGIRNVFMYLPAFAAGMIIYGSRNMPQRIGKQGLVIFLLLTAVLASFPFTRSMLLSTQQDFMDSDLFAMLWMLPLLPWIASSLRLGSGSFDRHLGNLSYPFYLVHEPIIQYLAMETGGLDKLWKLIALIAAIVATLILYFAADMPLERLRKFVLRAKSGEVRAVGTT